MQANWMATLDAKQAITVWAVCSSATAAGQLYSIKEGAGGRWRIGYQYATSLLESETVSELFFRNMNGKLNEGMRRTSGAAYDNGNGYPSNVKMSGNPWTTLAPAHILMNAWMPSSLFPLQGSSASPSTGWGCVVFDTYLDDSISAALADQQLTGTAVTDIRWVHLGANIRALGLKYDKSGDGNIFLELEQDLIRNAGAEGGRPLVKRDPSWSTEPTGWSF